MPIQYQKMIYRQDLRNNPKTIYVFGDNCIREGLGGQAKEMRGEPNALGVRTKWRPSRSPKEFFSDDDYDIITSLIKEDLDCIEVFLRGGNKVIFPKDGLGTGLSELPIRAPKIFHYLENRIKKLENEYGVEK